MDKTVASYREKKKNVSVPLIDRLLSTPKQIREKLRQAP